MKHISFNQSMGVGGKCVEDSPGDRAVARLALDEALKQLPPEQLNFAGLLEHTPLPWPDRVEITALRAEIERLLKLHQ